MNQPIQNLGELFPPKEVEQESPRQEWIRRHDLRFKHSRDCGMDEPWAVWAGEFTLPKWEETGETGATFDDALKNWAVRNRLRLWNEGAVPGEQAEPRTWRGGEGEL